MDTIHIIAMDLRKVMEEEERKLSPRLKNIDLMGKCAIASFRLQRALHEAGFQADFVLGSFIDSDHCWVSCSGWIVDITATQFGPFNRVYITEYDARFIPRKLNEPALKEIAEFWPPSQKPIKQSY